MAENAGGIYYTVDAVTEGLIDASKEADKALDDLEKALNKVDQSSKSTEKSVDSAGKALTALGKDAADTGKKVDSASTSLTDLGKDAADAGKKVDAAGAGLSTLGKEVVDAGKKVDTAATSVVDLGRDAADSGVKVVQLGTTADIAAKKIDTFSVAARRSTTETKEAAAAAQAENEALQKLLGRIDPLAARMQTLDKMTEELGKHFDGGRLSSSQYQQALAKLDSQYSKLQNDSAGYSNRVENEAQAFRQATEENKKYNSARQDTTKSSGALTAALKPLAAAVAGVITIQALKQWGALAEQFTLLQSRINRLSPTLAAGAANYQALLNIATQTGIALPDTVKLWETLTSSLKALGATDSQVLTLTGTLQKIGKIGGSSAEETSNALRQLGQSLSAGRLQAEEYNSIVEQTPELIRTLAKASGQSMGQFRQSMLDGKISANELFALLMKSVPGVNAEFDKMPRSAADAGNAVTVAFGAALSKLDQALGASQKLSKALDALANNINSISGNQTEQEKLNSLLEDQADTQRLINFENDRFFGPNKARLQQLIDLQNKQNDAIALTRKSLASKTPTETGGGGIVKPTTSPDGQKALKSQQDQIDALRVQGVERAKVIALQKLGNSATDEEKKKAQELAVTEYNLQEAEKDRQKAKTAGTAQAKKDQTELNRLANEQLAGANRAAEGIQKYADQLEIASLKGQDLDAALLEAEKISARASLGDLASPEDVKAIDELVDKMHELNQQKSLLQGVRSDVPGVGAEMDLEDQLKRYQDYRNAQLITDQQYLELKNKAETDYDTKRKAAQEEAFKNAALGNELLLNGIDALSQGATQSLSGILSGTSNLKDALGGISQTILNTVIGSFVQMGTEWVKKQIMMAAAAETTTATQVGGIATVTAAQNVATGTIAATTTTTAATTGGAVAASMAPAAGLSSIASFGGAAVIGGAALLATMAIAKSFSGRALGGPVQANGAYRINETGAPEIFNAANGRQYMLPNQRGQVVSNADATSGSGVSGGAAPIVNVHNYGNDSATASGRFSEADKRWVVDVIVGDIASGGRTGRVVNSTTGTRRVGS